MQNQKKSQSQIRLYKEFKEILQKRSQLRDMILVPKNQLQKHPVIEDITFVLVAPKQYPYQGRKFRIKMQWKQNYPWTPPKVSFIDKIWNPFVDYNTNLVCLDILNSQWSPALIMRTILLSLLSLFSQYKLNQHDNGYLNVQAAGQMKNNYQYYCKVVNEKSKKDCFSSHCEQYKQYQDQDQDVEMSAPTCQNIFMPKRNQDYQIIVENQQSIKAKIKQDIQNQTLKKKKRIKQRLRKDKKIGQKMQIGEQILPLEEQEDSIQQQIILQSCAINNSLKDNSMVEQNEYKQNVEKLQEQFIEFNLDQSKN